MAAKRTPPRGPRGLDGLRADVESSGLRTSYLLVGADRREMDQALAEIERRAVEPELAAMNAQQLRGPEDSFDDVVGACSILPMLGERRLVVVREPERLEGSPDALVAYLDDPTPTTCLVLVPVHLDRRLGWVSALEQRCVVVAFDPPQGRDLDAWVRRTLETHGVRVEADALALLVDLVQAETLLLTHEIEKLALATGKGGTLRMADVEALLGRSRTVDAWALTNAIEDGDPAAAVSALRRLFDQRVPVVALVGTLDWAIGRLVASEEPRMPPWREDAVRRRRAALRGRAERIFGLLRDADRAVRTTGSNAEAALERAVVEAAS